MNVKPTNPPTVPSKPATPRDLLDKHDHDGSVHPDADELVDTESDQRSPASDAPGWTLGTTRASCRCAIGAFPASSPTPSAQIRSSRSQDCWPTYGRK